MWGPDEDDSTWTTEGQPRQGDGWLVAMGLALLASAAIWTALGS